MPQLSITESDIKTPLCQSCGECCRVIIPLGKTSPRYRRFLRTAGHQLIPSEAAGAVDCCDKTHEARLDLGYCQHLRITETEGVRSFACGVYGRPNFPELCAQFNCVSWAKARDTYNTSNPLLVHAQRVLDHQRALRGAPPELSPETP